MSASVFDAEPRRRAQPPGARSRARSERVGRRSTPRAPRRSRPPTSEESRLLYDKTLSNIQEVKARDGIVLAVATQGDEKVRKTADVVIEIPPSSELLSPILEIVPLQLLAYHIAVRRGCDVDQPRNLAKSVTVE